jgi:hypothetical protein
MPQGVAYVDTTNRRVGINRGTVPSGALDVVSTVTNMPSIIARAMTGQTASVFSVVRGAGVSALTFGENNTSALSIRDDGYYPTLNLYQLNTSIIASIIGYNGLLIDMPNGQKIWTRDTSNASVLTSVIGTNYIYGNNYLKRPLSVATTDLGYGYQISAQTVNSTTQGIMIRGSVSQSVNLFEVQNSSSTVLLSIDQVGSISGAISPNIVSVTSTPFTLTNAHHGKIVEYNSATSGVINVGNTSDINIASWNCMVAQVGTAGFTITANTNTINSAGGLLKPRVQYSTVSLYRRSAGVFLLGGDLA